jgi:hypothetical protein
MKKSILLVYQIVAGIADAATGAMLIAAPSFTLHRMQLDVPPDALPFLSFIGAFVLAVGLSYLYGALLIRRTGGGPRLEAIWLVTAIVRSSVAVFVVAAIAGGSLEPGWSTIAFFDGACVLLQAVGLRKGWLSDVAR